MQTMQSDTGRMQRSWHTQKHWDYSDLPKLQQTRKEIATWMLANISYMTDLGEEAGVGASQVGRPPFSRCGDLCPWFEPRGGMLHADWREYTLPPPEHAHPDLKAWMYAGEELTALNRRVMESEAQQPPLEGDERGGALSLAPATYHPHLCVKVAAYLVPASCSRVWCSQATRLALLRHLLRLPGSLRPYQLWSGKFCTCALLGAPALSVRVHTRCLLCPMLSFLINRNRRPMQAHAVEAAYI